MKETTDVMRVIMVLESTGENYSKYHSEGRVVIYVGDREIKFVFRKNGSLDGIVNEEQS